MSLMKLFNFSYLKQNLKKSKVTLAFVLLILPILNLVIFLMNGLGDNISVFGLNQISILTVLGMYILPIILSIILFGYVFKKKSVDFMGSMPIDRKRIFFTNTLGGIGIIILLLLVTTILMLVANIILPNVHVPLGVLIDYLSIFTISYIFVFTACNIGVSVAGNIPTALVVTALILFFLPYHHFMYDRVLTSGNFTYYQLTNDCSECKTDENINKDEIYYTHLDKVLDKVNYTMPFEMISQVFEYDEEGLTYDITILGKMVLLSLVYILVGYIAFSKREMEICETSFKKFRTHQIVKYLTFIPILVVVSKILENSSFIALIFVVCLLLIYNFVYDLITRRSIIKVANNLISFSLVFIVVIFGCYLIINTNGDSHEKVFVISDIDSISANLDAFNYYSNGELVTVNDSSLKQKLIEGLFFNSMNSYDNNENTYNVDLELNIDGEYYQAMSIVEEDVYKSIVKYIKSTDIYKDKTLKELVLENEIIVLDRNYVELDEKGLEILESVVDNNTESVVEFYIPLSIYVYQNHKVKEYVIHSDFNLEFHKYIVDLYNKKAKDVDFDDVYSFNIERQTNEGGTYHMSATLPVKTKIKMAINKGVDFTKEVYKISIYRNGTTLYYYANLDKEFFDNLDSHSTYEDDVYYGY